MVARQGKPKSNPLPDQDEHMLTLGDILAEYPVKNTNYARAKQSLNRSNTSYKRAFTRGLFSGLLIAVLIIVILLIVGR